MKRTFAPCTYGINRFSRQEFEQLKDYQEFFALLSGVSDRYGDRTVELAGRLNGLGFDCYEVLGVIGASAPSGVAEGERSLLAKPGATLMRHLEGRPKELAMYTISMINKLARDFAQKWTIYHVDQYFNLACWLDGDWKYGRGILTLEEAQSPCTIIDAEDGTIVFRLIINADVPEVLQGWLEYIFRPVYVLDVDV